MERVWHGSTDQTPALATIPQVSEIDRIDRVLVVVAHPDDCDFGNAATTAKWTDAGVAVSYCIITDGDASDAPVRASRVAVEIGRASCRERV